MRLSSIALLAIAAAAPACAQPSSGLDAVLLRIDKAGAAFRGMSAHVRRVAHTAVINQDDVDVGTVRLKRARPHDLRMLVEITGPDPKTVAFQGRKIEFYYPKIRTVQEFDVGKSRELVDQFFLLGFGASRAELLASYQVRLAGPETVDGRPTQLLELIPKSKEVLQHLIKFEMWVGEDGYPVQQKFYTVPKGDYQLATYSDVKINPDLPDSALKLQLPKNVKREYPQR